MVNNYIDILPFGTLCKLIIILGLWCNAIYLGSAEERGFFVPLRRFGTKLPWILGYPLILCVNCMASLHSALILIVYIAVKDISWAYFPLTFALMAVCGSFVNGLVYLVFKRLFWDNVNNNKKNGLFGDSE